MPSVMNPVIIALRQTPWGWLHNQPEATSASPVSGFIVANTGFPNQLAKLGPHRLLVERYDWAEHGLPPSMIEFDTQVIPTARAMSFVFSGRVQLSKCRQFFTLPHGLYFPHQ